MTDFQVGTKNMQDEPGTQFVAEIEEVLTKTPQTKNNGSINAEQKPA